MIRVEAEIPLILGVYKILSGNGVFSKAGERLFDEYWMNYGKIMYRPGDKSKTITSFSEYLDYRGLPQSLNNPKAPKRKKYE